MAYSELTGEQVREGLDMQDAYRNHVAAQRQWELECRGSMRWARRKGRDYLLRKVGKTEKSLGPRSPETERIAADFESLRSRLSERMAGIAGHIERRAPVARALGLGRVPEFPARIIRRLDEAGLLGREVAIGSTTALFAYEAMAGVQFEPDDATTAGLTLIWSDPDRPAAELSKSGIVDVLKKTDSSFGVRPDRELKLVNSTGVAVRLVRMRTEGDWAGDPAQWIEATALDRRGFPLRVVAPDPRHFAVWRMQQSSRSDLAPQEMRRDRAQSLAVAEVAAERLGMRFDGECEKLLPVRYGEAFDTVRRHIETRRRLLEAEFAMEGDEPPRPSW